MAAITSRDVEYAFGQTRMLGYFAAPQIRELPLPAVLVVHGGFGLVELIKRRVEQLAELGYAALAADVWGDRLLPRTPAEFVPLIKAISDDHAQWMGKLRAAQDALEAQPEVDRLRIAAIGYCFGGSSVLEYARTGGDVRGVVSFHGGLDLVSTAWSTAGVLAKVLVCTGADDHMAPAASVLELQAVMSAAGVDWEVDCYSATRHAYTFSDGPDFNPQSDRRSWNALCHFLQELFDE